MGFDNFKFLFNLTPHSKPNHNMVSYIVSAIITQFSESEFYKSLNLKNGQA